MTDSTRAGRRLLAHNTDALLALAALPVFVVADLPLAGWFWAVAIWGVNRFLGATIERYASGLPALRAVGVMGASMLLRPWIGMLVLFLATRDDAATAISSTVLLVLLLTLDIATRVATHRNVRRHLGAS
jgi:hypothetical protein